MKYDEATITDLVNRLSPLGNISTKRMFGGIGFFHDAKMFAMIGEDLFRLKVNDTNRKDYEERDLGPFISGKKGRTMPYYEVPPDILENDSMLHRWAQKSIDIAHNR